LFGLIKNEIGTGKVSHAIIPATCEIEVRMIAKSLGKKVSETPISINKPWWYTSTIPAMQEAQIGRLWSRLSWTKM
jgi:hypothetical protein